MDSKQFSEDAYSIGLEKVAANYMPLTPLSFFERTASVYPERTSVIHGHVRFTWRETYARCRQLASALIRHNIRKGSTVAFLVPNVPAIFEAHFGVPMSGAVLNAINTRLDVRTIAHILSHSNAAAVFVDVQLLPLIQEALHLLDKPLPGGGAPLVVVIEDSTVPELASAGSQPLPHGMLEYESFLSRGDPEFAWVFPSDEWEAISLNYTSGTTSNPKGVVFHHRGAYLAAVSNAVNWDMGMHPVYLWTLPMFHCNGWCFPWTIAALAGTSVCLRQVVRATIFSLIEQHGVSHLCGAPVVVNSLAHATETERRPLPNGGVAVMTAGAAPPPSVLAAAESLGFRVTHTYGLTETYGPSVICAWKADQWDALPSEERDRLKARQGVRYLALEALDVKNPETMESVPRDGSTMGEVTVRGNMVMKGYLKNTEATRSAFAGGWFRTGDLGVMHSDGYLQLRDRSKDIIISGGENISSIAVESAIYRHPAVMEAAVVAKADEKWGEVPCAFVTPKPGFEGRISEADIIAFCRQELAHFMAPRYVVFGPLPKTSTGKVQKFVLREEAKKVERKAPRSRL